MAKTKRLSLLQISDWHNVSWAMHKASRGKRSKPEVQEALKNPEQVINQVSGALSQAKMPIGEFKSFTIFDPKQRLIHAAPFVDRIAHHAIIKYLEPTFERVLLPSVFACRVGKGVHAAIAYAQHQFRRHRWVMHLDIAQYFPSIDHHILQQQLSKRFCGDALPLLDAVINAHHQNSAKGLPIGALTSQHFANHYLNEADRWCLSQPNIKGHCRYMDDFLVWAESKQALKTFHVRFVYYLQKTLKLSTKPPLIQKTEIGLLFCGVKIKPYCLKPSLRRRRRYKAALKHWQKKWDDGVIDSLTLQKAYASAHTILLPAADKAWQKSCLHNIGVVDA